MPRHIECDDPVTCSHVRVVHEKSPLACIGTRSVQAQYCWTFARFLKVDALGDATDFDCRIGRVAAI